MFRKRKAEALTADDVRNVVYNEMTHFLDDIEFRVRQAYEVAARTTGNALGHVFAEDLNLNVHMLTGYTVTANSPAAGSIAWASVHVVYNGTDYAMADGNTANKFVWFDPNVANGTTTLQTSNTKPDLSANPKAALLFVNNSGTPFDVLSASIPGVLQNNAVDAGAIQPFAITAGKMNTIQHLLY